MKDNFFSFHFRFSGDLSTILVCIPLLYLCIYMQRREEFVEEGNERSKTIEDLNQRWLFLLAFPTLCLHLSRYSSSPVLTICMDVYVCIYCVSGSLSD